MRDVYADDHRVRTLRNPHFVGRNLLINPLALEVPLQSQVGQVLRVLDPGRSFDTTEQTAQSTPFVHEIFNTRA